MTWTSGSGLDAISSLKCELASEVLCLSGHLRLQVNGWSMLPSVQPGDTLMIERANLSEVSTGDIVLFGRDQRLFAHRVVAKRSRAANAVIITRGDAMPHSDLPVIDTQLLGRVSYIVRNGRLIRPAKSLLLSERVEAAIVQRSSSAARFTMGVRGYLQKSKKNQPEPAFPCSN